jgi:hypothetical protein
MKDKLENITQSLINSSFDNNKIFKFYKKNYKKTIYNPLSKDRGFFLSNIFISIYK